MNKSKLENSEKKTITLNKSKKDVDSSPDKNPRTEIVKTPDHDHYDEGDDGKGKIYFSPLEDSLDGSGNGYPPGTGPSDWEREIEEANLLPFGDKSDKEDIKVLKSNPSEQMDEIIKSNDKFETIKVLMEILCKELGIPVESSLPDIGKALHRVTEDYYKAIDTWRAISKKPANIDIRQ